MYREQLTKYIYPFFAFFLPLALYIWTLSPTYVPIDSAEFTLCMHFWGLCHPPGFPLYVILGHFFTDIFPIGTLAWRANLFSAVFGALTVLVVYLAFETLEVKKQIALFVSFLFAVSFIFWEYSVSADVFTFATFLIALSVLALFNKRLFAAAFVLGLSASHFYITLVLLPFFYWYNFGFKIKLREGLFLGLIFLVGFFPQVLMYFRSQQNPEINWGHAKGLVGFYHYLRRTEFGSIFLIANPVLVFSPVKFFKHVWEYFPALLVNFGVILPLFVLLSAAVCKLFSDRRAQLLMFCFLTLLFVQLFLLSTIDPTGEDNPFQIGKFYLTSFVFAVFLMGMAFSKLNEKFFENNVSYATFLLSLLVLVYFVSNFRVVNMNGNYFSENMVLDAMDQLEENSIAITVSHIFYFGALYEQKVNGKYQGVTMLYFPNEKNRDSQNYHPEVFNRGQDTDFIGKVKTGKSLGKAEEYVLSTISKNLDKPIHIYQGTFEEGFFAYLKPYIRPHGMWWKVEPNRNATVDLAAELELFDLMRNRNVKYDDIFHRAQRQDTLNYAVAYHSMGVYLGSVGKYEQATDFMRKSYNVRPKGDNVLGEIELLEKSWNLEKKYSELVQDEDSGRLAELGNNLFTLANYKRCSEVYVGLLEIVPTSAHAFNNLASCQANLGQVGQARANYEKAIALDGQLTIARQGLEALGK